MAEEMDHRFAERQECLTINMPEQNPATFGEASCVALAASICARWGGLNPAGHGFDTCNGHLKVRGSTCWGHINETRGV